MLLKITGGALANTNVMNLIYIKISILQKDILIQIIVLTIKKPIYDDVNNC